MSNSLFHKLKRDPCYFLHNVKGAECVTTKANVAMPQSKHTRLQVKALHSALAAKYTC